MDKSDFKEFKLMHQRILSREQKTTHKSMRKKIANHVFQKVQYPEYINKSYNTTKTQSNFRNEQRI